MPPPWGLDQEGKRVVYCLLTTGEAGAVWVGEAPGTRHAVDITDTFETRVDSLKAHRKYIVGLCRERFDAAESLQDLARRTGTRLGVRMAVGLEVHDFGGG